MFCNLWSLLSLDLQFIMNMLTVESKKNIRVYYSDSSLWLQSWGWKKKEESSINPAFFDIILEGVERTEDEAHERKLDSGRFLDTTVSTTIIEMSFIQFACFH